MKSHPRLRRVCRLLGGLVLVYVLAICALAMWQNRLIYFPFHAPEARMLELARSEGMAPWRDQAGEIIGWQTAAARDRPAANRMVVFHGDTGYALHRTHFCKGFERIEGGAMWEVYLFEYPGFGARAGTIGVAPFVEASLSMIEMLQAADARPIYLVGESLGSGLACATAAARPSEVAGLLLITPYRSIGEVAAFHYPWFPVSLLLKKQWDNRGTLASYPGRVAVVVAENDEVIPSRQGRALFEEAREPKRLWLMPGATHNGLDFSLHAPWWREVSDFLLDRR